METFPAVPEGLSSAAEMHTRIESMKLAYSDLRRYDADPRSYDVPVSALISKEYARKRAALIDPAKANCGVTPGTARGQRYHLPDGRGQGRQHRQLDPEHFGGIWLRNHGGWDGVYPAQSRGILYARSQASERAGRGKRPVPHDYSRVMERGDMHVGFGIMGGPNQPLAHAQFVSNMVDYGMNVQAALEARGLPRG